MKKRGREHRQKGGEGAQVERERERTPHPADTFAPSPFGSTRDAHATHMLGLGPTELLLVTVAAAVLIGA